MVILGLLSCFWIDDGAVDAKVGVPRGGTSDTADDTAVDTAERDGDGDGVLVSQGDCDDTDASVYPGAPEDCSDATDKNCDGAVGRVDGDADGFVACEECDDGDTNVHPGADETCNEVDDDCDGAVDEDAVDATAWYADADGDGFGALDAAAEFACSAPPDTVADHTDCDDGNALVNPIAPETCNHTDDNCNGEVDEHFPGIPSWFLDADGDGYGGSEGTVESCDQPVDHVANAADCDDARADVNPDAGEVCDSIDNDCDGGVDVGATGAPSWYRDADGDTYGDAASVATSCDAPAGYVADATDCDDTESTTSPGAPEVCDDGVDNDCDGTGSGCWASLSLSGEIKYTGAAANDLSGYALGVADTDGDGYPDLLVAAPGSHGYRGSVLVVPGSAAPASASLSGLVELTGDAAYDYAGYSVAGVGDLDGDGTDEVLVGSESNSAYVVFGPASSGGLASELELTGAGVLDLAGRAVAAAGDVDDDGTPDLLVGAYGYVDSTGDPGAAYVVSGATVSAGSLSGSLRWTGEAAGDGAGSAVGPAGDVDGDGVADFLVASPYNDDGAAGAGAAYLVLGTSGLAGGTLSSFEYTGEAMNDLAGSAVGAAGDANADGYADFVIGASGADDGGSSAGQAYLVLGSGAPASGSLSAELEYYGPTYARAGYAVGPAGDLDDDGFDDFIVGAPYTDGDASLAGSAYVVLGSSAPAGGALAGEIELRGATRDDTTGFAAIGLGDFDGDGNDDVAVGAQGGSSYRGLTYVVLGTGI